MPAPTAERLQACTAQHKRKKQTDCSETLCQITVHLMVNQCTTQHLEKHTGVAVDKNDGDSGKEEDEGPPPLRDGPSSDSNEDDDSYDEIADNDNVDNVATTDDDSEAIKL